MNIRYKNLEIQEYFIDTKFTKKEKEAESQENQEVKEHLRLQLLKEVKKRVKANE